jgi:hypothetical protein
MEKYNTQSEIEQLETLAIPVEEHLFDETVHLTGITEFGVSWQDLTTGKVAPPPQGARFVIYFEGTLEGPRIKGKLSGVDFLTVRADGRFILDLHLTITTEDGENIYAHEDGILIPPQDDSRIAGLKLNMHLSTASPQYSWVNQLQVWARGTVDWNTGEVQVRAYAG